MSFSKIEKGYVFSGAFSGVEVNSEANKYSENNYIERLLPNEMLVKIFDYLGTLELLRAVKVNKRFNYLVAGYFSPIKKCIFDSEKWKLVLGSGVKIEKSCLPEKILELLLGPCPFSPEKEMIETHVPIRVTEVNGKFLKIKWATNIKKSKISIKIDKNLNPIYENRRYWFLITKENVDLEKVIKNKTVRISDNPICESTYGTPTACEVVMALALQIILHTGISFPQQRIEVLETNGDDLFFVRQNQKGMVIDKEDIYKPFPEEKATLLVRRFFDEDEATETKKNVYSPVDDNKVKV